MNSLEIQAMSLRLDFFEQELKKLQQQLEQTLKNRSNNEGKLERQVAVRYFPDISHLQESGLMQKFEDKTSYFTNTSEVCTTHVSRKFRLITRILI